MFKKITGRIKGISTTDKIMFSHNLAVMIETGLSPVQAFQSLAEQTENPKFKKIISQIGEKIRQGQSLSNSLANYPKIFSPFYINMVRLGEAEGKLSRILKILAKQMEKDHELIKKVKGAMLYPGIVATVLLGIGILMMLVVIPKLNDFFNELGMELPLTTRAAIEISNFLKNNLILCLLGIIVVFILIKLISKIKMLKKITHFFHLHLPILGPLTKKINLARFARALNSLTESGMSMAKSLETIAKVLNNFWFRQTLLNAAREIRRGKGLSQSLNKYKKLYSPMTIQMINTGEETGRLSEVLEKLADFYEKEVDYTIKNLSSVLEPAIIIIIGAAVAFLAISIIQPIYSIMGRI
jgi:type IV pilus assembly protein PilC